MKRPVTVSLLTLLSLAGCASQPTNNAPRPVVVVSIAVPDVSSNGKNVASHQALYPKLLKPIGTGPVVNKIRVCNESRSECKLGVATVDTKVMLLAASSDSAKLRVNLAYQVDSDQTFSNGSGMGITSSVPDHPPTLKANETVSKTVDLPYGTVRHVQLPHGVDVAYCVISSKGSQEPQISDCQDDAVKL